MDSLAARSKDNLASSFMQNNQVVLKVIQEKHSKSPKPSIISKDTNEVCFPRTKNREGTQKEILSEGTQKEMRTFLGPTNHKEMLSFLCRKEDEWNDWMSTNDKQ